MPTTGADSALVAAKRHDAFDLRSDAFALTRVN